MSVCVCVFDSLLAPEHLSFAIFVYSQHLYTNTHTASFLYQENKTPLLVPTHQRVSGTHTTLYFLSLISIIIVTNITFIYNWPDTSVLNMQLRDKNRFCSIKIDPNRMRLPIYRFIAVITASKGVYVLECLHIFTCACISFST